MAAIPAQYTRKSSGGVLRFVARFLTRVALLLVLCVGGGLLWLRTDHAETLVLETLVPMVNQSLAVQGLSVQAAGLSGPLPLSARVQGLRVHDIHGEFFRAEALSFRLAFVPLLQGTVLVEELIAQAPELSRLPDLPPAPEPEESAPPLVQIQLPVVVRVDSLRVTGASLPAALAGLAPPQALEEMTGEPQGKGNNPEAVQNTGAPLMVNLEGTALLEKGIVTVGATLGLSLAPAGGEGGLAADGLAAGGHAASGLAAGGFAATLTLETLRADLSSAGQNAVELDALLALKTGGLEESLRLRVQAETSAERVRLAALNLEGAGLNLTATGFALWPGFSHEQMGGVLPFGAELRVRGAESAQWPRLAETLAGGPLPALQALADPLDIVVRTEERAGETRIVLERLLAGTFEGRGHVALAEHSGHGGLNIEARLDMNLGDLGAFLPVPSGSAAGPDDSTPASAGSETPPLSGPLAVALAVQGTLPALTADVQAGQPGPLALLEQLQTSITVESPRLATPGGLLEALRAELVTSVHSLAGGSVDAGGTFRFSAREGSVGTATAQADWQVSLPPAAEGGVFAESGSVGVSGLGLNVFGIQASGNLRTHLAPEFLNTLLAGQGSVEASGPFPAASPPALVLAEGTGGPDEIFASLAMPAGLWLEGDLSLRVADWSPLSGLAGTGIRGEGASVSVRLARQGGTTDSPAPGGQGIHLEARLPSLAMPESGVRVNAAHLNIEAALPPVGGVPSLKLDAATGPGEAGGIAWKEVRATVGGNGRQGDFSATVIQEVTRTQGRREGQAGSGSRGKQAQTAAQGKAAAKNTAAGNNSNRLAGKREELLALSGAYNWAVPELTIQTLSVQMPDSGQDMTGLRLRQPLRISLSDGLALSGADFAFFPEGTLLADLRTGATGITAHAFVGGLPLDIIRRVTGADVPAGRLDADLDLAFGSRENPADPKAALRAELRLDQSGGTLEKHSRVRMRANADGTVNMRAGRPKRDEASAGAGDGPVSPQPGESPETRKPAPAATGNFPVGAAGSSGARGAKFPAGTPDIALEASIVRQGGRLVFAGGAAIALAGEAPAGPVSPVSPNHSAGAQGEVAKPLTFTVPLLVVDGVPQPDMHAPFKAALAWSGRVEKLWHLALKPDIEISGAAQCNLAVSGTLQSPKTEGTAYLAGGRLYDKGQSVLLADIQLEARASGTRDYFLALTATDGAQGTLGLEGKLELNEVPEFALRGQARHFAPLNRDDVDLTFSGRFGATGSVLAPKISAAVIVERGEVTLPSLGGAGVRTLEISEDRAEKPVISKYGPVCDITVEIPGRFHVRGFGLDSEWQGSMAVNGPLAEPELTGSLRPVRGFLEILSRPFAFSGGQIEFAGGTRINPGLDLELTYAGGGDIEAVVKTGGTLQKPALELQSRPPLPQDEVLAHVLFGKSVSQLSRFEALQLANGMRELAGFGEGGFSPLTAMRRTVGLDVLRLGGGTTGEEQRHDSGMSGMENLTGPQASTGGGSPDDGLPSLEAGKYITDNIFIGVEQGATPESTGVRVEIELFPSVTVQGRTSSSSSQAGVGWKMDY